MKNHVTIYIGVIFYVLYLFLIGCEREKNTGLDQDVHYKKIGNLLITTDQDYLNSIISYKDEIVRVGDIDARKLKSSKGDPEVDLSKDYVFKLQAEHDPPIYEGNKLMATHVTICNDYAFVTYNTRGDKYLGGFIVFDVSNIKRPTPMYQAVHPYGDFSAVEYYNNKLYLVGATDVYRDTNGLEEPAFLEVVSLDNMMNVVGVDTIIDLFAYAGTDIKVTDDKIYATCGSNGGLRIFDHHYNLLHYEELEYARSIDDNTEKVYVFQGMDGRVNVFDKTTNVKENTFNLGGATIPESKTELETNDEYIFAALNDGGLAMLNLDGSHKQNIPKPETPAGEIDENYVTNSVTLNGELLLIGNGEAGVYISALNEENNDSIVLLGKFEFKDSESTNFVESDSLVIFVATGLGGLKILSINEDDGLPDDIIATEPCEALLSDILGMFPEEENNIEKYPELFDGSTELNIKLIEESEVYVTFIEEVALWKNSFGYYSYDAGNPPASIDDIEKHIIFPNVSKVNNGGGLEYGDMVKIGKGPFPANTVIGFYLVAKGWRFGILDDGIYTNYTNKEFNQNYNQQHVLFIDEECNDLVVAFEDMQREEADNDFNDIIFTVKDNPTDTVPNTSFNLENIPVK